MPASRRILAGYFTLAGLYTLSAALIWGVNTLFLLNAGLSFFEVFIANAAFSAGMVLFEVPTGVVADTLGRRVSFLLSVTRALRDDAAVRGAGAGRRRRRAVRDRLGRDRSRIHVLLGRDGGVARRRAARDELSGAPRPRVRARAADHGRRDARRDGRGRPARADQPLAPLHRPDGAAPRRLRRRLRRHARPRFRAAACHRRGAPRRDREERESRRRVRLAAAQPPAAHARVGRAARVLLVGVLRRAAVPARAPRQRRRLDRGLRRCGDRALDHRGEPGRHASPRATAESARPCCSLPRRSRRSRRSPSGSPDRSGSRSPRSCSSLHPWA